ncbi:hypothetical protein ACFPN2_01985 [Steroidobacter flavus]|uniref:ABC transporter permease n=1 Tax=Steroidobacter flavus TaxID=1842136 RepID=A0ABV8SML8_9GAMM
MATEGRSDRITPAPTFLRRHPALWVEWLRVANSLSRLRGDGLRAVLLVLCAVAVVVALVFLLTGRVAGAVETLAEYWVLLAAVAAVYAASSVSGRRRQLEESKSQSWLIATPIPPRSLIISQAIRVLLPLCALVVMVVMVPALAALTTEGIVASAEKVAGAAAAGLFIGGVIGWWTARRTQPSGVVPSRYVPRPRVRRAAVARSSGKPPQVSSEPAQTSRQRAQDSSEAEQTSRQRTQGSSEPEQTSRQREQVLSGPEQATCEISQSSETSANGAAECTSVGMQPDSAGLAGWPIAQVLSWSRPENSRYVLIAALLAVQGGSSAVAGLSVVAMYFVASYLAALVSAMTTVAKSAAIWLRATPITLMGFVWSVSRRAFAHQCIGVALAVICMVLLARRLAWRCRPRRSGSGCSSRSPASRWSITIAAVRH